MFWKQPVTCVQLYNVLYSVFFVKFLFVTSYRPISNLPYASKVLERHVSAQLHLHLQHNNIGDPFQSAYRPSHSVETAIVSIQDDILRSLDTRKHVVLVLLDLSAAFDTIDHDLLAELDRIGVRGDALCWLASYLTDRTQCVNVDGHLSCNIQLRHGVPQGSVLGPLLFSVYCAGLSRNSLPCLRGWHSAVCWLST